VVAPDTWLKDPASEPARFLSQDEETEEEAADSEDSSAFTVSTPVAARASVEDREVEPEAIPARPQFAELAEEPTSAPLPSDYASDFGNTERYPAEAEAPVAQPQAPKFTEAGDAAQPDLDVPAFMRRVRF
jgi:hypothetical protein